jgi:hypothetical protein
MIVPPTSKNAPRSSATGAIIFLADVHSIPGTGTYSFYNLQDTLHVPATGQFVGVGGLGNTNEAATALFIATSGTIHVTSVTSTRILGTFTLSGVGRNAADSTLNRSVSVTGAFRAAKTNQTPPPPPGHCDVVKC